MCTPDRFQCVLVIHYLKDTSQIIVEWWIIKF